MRGLAELPQAVAEVPEGAARGFPLRSVGSKPQAWPPILQHQSWKETQITSLCEKQQKFCQPGRDS